MVQNLDFDQGLDSSPKNQEKQKKQTKEWQRNHYRLK